MSSDKLLVVEIGAALILAPLLLFPRRISIIALILLPALWLCRLIVRRDIARGAWDVPWAGLLLMTLVSLYPSVDLTLSRPKLFGLVLGFYAFGLTVQYARTDAARRLFGGGLVVAGLGISLLGLVGAKWNHGKLQWLDPLYSRLPHLITSVQTSFSSADSGIHPNEIGGTLALLLPIAVAGALLTSSRRLRMASAASVVMMAATLVLSASRSALAGVLMAVTVLAVLRWRRLVFGVPVALAAAASVGAMEFGPARVAQSFAALDAASGSSGIGRLEVWSRALDMIQDFPFTGIGLNTFPVILNAYYPLFSADPGAASLPHAHNLFLQTAVDLGVVGLVCFVALWVLAGVGLVRAWHATAVADKRMAIAGLGAGLLGHFIYSQTDAVALGAKPGTLLWAILGAAATSGGAIAYSRARFWAWLQWLLFAGACMLGIALTLLGIRAFPM